MSLNAGGRFVGSRPSRARTTPLRQALTGGSRGSESSRSSSNGPASPLRGSGATFSGDSSFERPSVACSAVYPTAPAQTPGLSKPEGLPPRRPVKYSYLLPSERGTGLTRAEASVLSLPTHCEVFFRVPKAEMDEMTRRRHPYLHWGLFRASPDRWSTPTNVQVIGLSEDDPSNPIFGHKAYNPSPGATRTPMRISVDQRYYELRLYVPKNLVPLSMAFTFFVHSHDDWKLKEKHFRPRDRKHCTVLLGGGPGVARPYGATLLETTMDSAGVPRYTVNFALFSQSAKAVNLVLVRRRTAPDSGPNKGFLEVALDPVANRTGSVWHIAVDGLRDLDTLYYGWRAEGDVSWEDGGRFDHGKVMVDPYAQQVEEFDQPAGMPQMLEYDGTPRKLVLGCLGGVFGVPECEVPRNLTPLSASSSAPKPEGLRVLAVHIPTFTDHPHVPEPLRGKFPGLVYRAPDLRELGINCVLLSQVLMSRPGLGPLGKAPLSFFTPDPTMVAGMTPDQAGCSWEASLQMRQMVADLKAHGIRVMMQLSFAFTAEGKDEEASPLLCLRGLDNDTYYRAGGVLNCGNAETGKLIAQTLKHWHLQYGIDGFYLASPEPLVMSNEGVVEDSSRAAEWLAYAPQMGQGVAVVVGGSLPSLLPREGCRGFPHYGHLSEAPGKFQEDVISAYLLRNQRAALPQVAEKLAGSPSICTEDWTYPGHFAVGRDAGKGAIWNSPMRPGGGSLWRSCEQATENRTEGHFSALSLFRTAVLMTCMARGVPLLTIGEDYVNAVPEPTRSQILTWVKAALDVRARHAPLFRNKLGVPGGLVLKWFDTDGNEPDWTPEGASKPSTLCMMLLDAASRKGLFAIFNPGAAAVVRIPETPTVKDAGWALVLDSVAGEVTIEFAAPMRPGYHYNVAAGSSVLFRLV